MILIKEAINYIRENTGSILELIEFCVFDDHAVEYFKKEFEKID